MEDNKRKVTSNPSRKQCVSMIQRILMTEVLEKGRNQQFKKSTDFMTFFESLSCLPFAYQAGTESSSLYESP